MKTRSEQFWHGVDLARKGFKCPEDAPEATQKGYGVQRAAEQAKPPISVEDAFESVFGKGDSK